MLIYVCSIGVYDSLDLLHRHDILELYVDFVMAWGMCGLSLIYNEGTQSCLYFKLFWMFICILGSINHHRSVGLPWGYEAEVSS
jgi:hypothetical protein